MAFTLATVSIKFSPDRLETSNVTAGLPLIRAKLVGSLKLRRTSPISPKTITASPCTVTGRIMISSTVLMRPGIFNVKLPRPVSCVPAATSLLDFFTLAMASAGLMP